MMSPPLPLPLVPLVINTIGITFAMPDDGEPANE
jgi:hypothetical protein